MTDALHVLIVDDDPGVGETLARQLELEREGIVAAAEQRASDALDRIRDESIECVVSDYEMPSMDGLDLLAAVREIDEDLPFILFTGSGSESLASDALSRDVTDYVQKSGTKETATVLANRIENGIESYRAKQALERERERYRTFLEQSTDLIAVVDASGQFSYVSQAWQRLMGYDPDDLVGENAFELMHAADAPDVWTEFKESVNNPDETRSAQFRFEHADGDWRWLEAVGNNQLSNPLIEGFIVNVRDVTERHHREQELRRQNDRLEQFASVVSHDLRNPMNVISGRLELAAETGEETHIDAARDALTRMDEMVDELLDLAREGQSIEETEPVCLPNLLEDCRQTVDSDGFSLDICTDMTLEGDRTRLRRVFENLLRNAVEHASADATVTVDELADGSGFYVEDDGPGIPPEERENALETGYTTASDGSGLGLAIVERIVEAHGWTISITDGTDGGARFEITAVDRHTPPCEPC
ncbi:MAG: PAS domain S-box protein [Halorientalis sp.]